MRILSSKYQTYAQRNAIPLLCIRGYVNVVQSKQFQMPPWVKQGQVARSVITPANNIVLLDLSELYRPEGKDVDAFRIFDEKLAKENPLMARVYKTYTEMHTKQTVDFVKSKHKEWLNFDHAEYTVMEAMQVLGKFLDESDPDVDIANSLHGYQTAERIRKAYPNEKWFHLTGLIHDMGKVMALHGEKQFATVGDTFPVGCLPAESVVFRHTTFNQNPDLKDERYNTKFGMYEENCGLDNLTMSWGHDEYLYRVLKNHPTCRLPEEALYAIRFHSFYPWHTGGDYSYFMNERDHELFYWLKEFNKFDLYTKSDELPEPEKLREYYQSLIDEFIPGPIRF